MKITVEMEIKPQQLADLFITAIESGDPVTCAARGGWCEGIYWQTKGSPLPGSEPVAATAPDGQLLDYWDERLRASGCKAIYGPWYEPASLYERDDFQLEIVEVDDETTGHTTGHIVTAANIAAGLKIMADKFPHQFNDVVTDNIDASTADIFLQCVVFGEEKYA